MSSSESFATSKRSCERASAQGSASQTRASRDADGTSQRLEGASRQPCPRPRRALRIVARFQSRFRRFSLLARFSLSKLPGQVQQPWDLGLDHGTICACPTSCWLPMDHTQLAFLTKLHTFVTRASAPTMNIWFGNTKVETTRGDVALKWDIACAFKPPTAFLTQSNQKTASNKTSIIKTYHIASPAYQERPTSV